MNRKQLFLILVAGLVLGGIGWYLHSQKSTSFERTANLTSVKLLGDFPVNQVAQITIRDNTNRVDLVKDDTWTVKERADYPANATDIISFARKLWDLHAVQSQSIGESLLGRLELLPPDKGGTNSGTLVELKDKDGKLIRSLLLGKKSMRESPNASFGGSWPNGRWIYLPDKPGTAYVVSETFDRIEPKPEQWLDKDFFKVQKIKSISVTYPEATNSWSVSRTNETGNDWVLADARPDEKLDSSKTSSFSWALSSPTFNDVVVDPKPAVLGLDKPTTISLGTFEGFDYTMKVGAKTNNDLAMTVKVTGNFPKERTPGKDEKPADKQKLDKAFADNLKKLEEKLSKEKSLEKWTYLVSSYTLDSLLKKRSELLVEKKSEPASTNAAPVSAKAATAAGSK